MLLVWKFSRILAEEDIEPALVSGVGDHHQHGEEEEGEHCLPDLYEVLRNKDQHHQEPGVGQDGEQGSDAEHGKLVNPEIIGALKLKMPKQAEAVLGLTLKLRSRCLMYDLI